MKTPFAWFALLPLAVGFLAPACADDAQCDDTQKVVDGNCVCDDDHMLLDGECVPKTAGAGGAAGGDAGAGGSSGAGGSPGDSGSTCTGPDVEFGAACTDGTGHTDCGCPADYCAVQPGMAFGICTRTGCVEDPSVCPDGWGCLDLSAFMAGLPSICTAP